MERMVRGGAGSLLLTPSPSRTVCNAAVLFHTLVQLVPYFYSVSAHCSNPHSTFRHKLHSKPHTHTHTLCSPVHFSLQQTEETAITAVYSMSTQTLHMLVFTHTLSAMLVLITRCLIYQPCVCTVQFCVQTMHATSNHLRVHVIMGKLIMRS